MLAAFKAGEVQILLGTQMIAKGLDFPNVTLVGVVNADTALHLPDFRAAERTFQLVAQVAGRTGRGDRPGRVLVQTYCPDHPAILHAVRTITRGSSPASFPSGQRFGVPPVRPDGPADRPGTRGIGCLRLPEEACSRRCGRPRTPRSGSSVRPRLPSSRSAISSAFTFRPDARLARPLQRMLRDLAGRFPPPHGIELAVDVDPISML